MPDAVNFYRKPVLVLGGSGYIGSRLVAALTRHTTYRPVATSRRSAVALDATNLDAVIKALRNVDCVINCIAGTNQVMLAAIEAICNAARVEPPRRLIHLSSMAVYGAASGMVQEDWSAVPPISDYGEAKINCERVVQKYVDDGGDAVILRPTCVFGKNSPQWTVRLAHLLRAGRIGDLGAAGDGYCNLAFIDDVIAAIIATVDAPNVSGHAFNISSSSEMTWNAFMIAFGRALDATPVRRISRRHLQLETKVLAPIRLLAGKFVRSPMTEAITPSLAALWRQDIRIDCAAARAALGLHQTTAERMIAAVVKNDSVVKEQAIP